MKVGIIGAGRVGCAFAFALASRGVEITGVYSKSFSSSSYIANKLNMNNENNLQQLVKNADVILITVPDSFIQDVSTQIISLCDDEIINGKIFLHMSGALTSDSLKPLDEAGGYIGSYHPIQTFADKENSWQSLFNIYFGFEGSNQAEMIALELTKVLDGNMLKIEAKTKPLYHAAACILSNYTTTLSYVTESVLESAGIERETGMKAFAPLLINTMRNIIEVGSKAALTGPISRGDCSTVAGHLAAIGKENIEIASIYKALGKITVELALKKGSIGPDQAKALMEELRNVPFGKEV